MALLLAVAWHLRRPRIDPTLDPRIALGIVPQFVTVHTRQPAIEIPKRTYIGVAMSIVHAGGRPTFRDERWVGAYQLKPLAIWDCARIFTAGMYSHQEEAVRKGMMQTVSFHWNKTLGIQQGGAILHDDPEADRWLRK